MGTRKNILYLTSIERSQFFEALLKMKANIVNPAVPAADRYSVLRRMVYFHSEEYCESL